MSVAANQSQWPTILSLVPAGPPPAIIIFIVFLLWKEGKGRVCDRRCFCSTMMLLDNVCSTKNVMGSERAAAIDKVKRQMTLAERVVLGLCY